MVQGCQFELVPPTEYSILGPDFEWSCPDYDIPSSQGSQDCCQGVDWSEKGIVSVEESNGDITFTFVDKTYINGVLVSVSDTYEVVIPCCIDNSPGVQASCRIPISCSFLQTTTCIDVFGIQVDESPQGLQFGCLPIFGGSIGLQTELDGVQGTPSMGSLRRLKKNKRKGPVINSQIMDFVYKRSF